MEYPFVFPIRYGPIVGAQIKGVAFIEPHRGGGWQIGGVLIEECEECSEDPLRPRSTTLAAGHFSCWEIRGWLNTERQKDIDYEWERRDREVEEYEPEIA